MPETNQPLPEPDINIGGLRGPREEFHPVKYDLESELTYRDPNSEYKIYAVKYQDKTEKAADGALFEIVPNGKTPIMDITKDGYVARRQMVEGSGTLLAILPSGEIKTFEVSADAGTIFHQGKGWVDCWIAGPNGLKIIDSSQPGFQTDFEDEVSIDDPKYPLKFWQEYHKLTDN